jgi:hypothetical protein
MMIPQSTVNELVQLCVVRSEAAAQFKEAIKAQALLYEVHPTALRRYVAAIAEDTLEELRNETLATRDLIHQGQMSLRFEEDRTTEEVRA